MRRIPSGLGKVWAVRTAWQQGDAEAIELLCKQVESEKPNNTYVDLIAALAASRLDADQGGLERLKALIGGGQEIPAVLAGYLVIDLTRAMRREGEANAAAELLQSAVSRTPSPSFSRPSGREARWAYFGVAFDIGQGLRVDPADLGSCGAGGCFLPGFHEKLETRLRPIPDALRTRWVRARALGQLFGRTASASSYRPEATRHVGQPGDTELGSPRPTCGTARASLARGAQGSPPGKHTAMSQHIIGSRSTRPGNGGTGGSSTRRRSHAPPHQTPWAAWLYGRLLRGARPSGQRPHSRLVTMGRILPSHATS